MVIALQGSIKSYSAADMCASPAQDYKYAPLILHDVVLSSLVRSAKTLLNMPGPCPCRWLRDAQHNHRRMRPIAVAAITCAVSTARCQPLCYKLLH